MKIWTIAFDDEDGLRTVVASFQADANATVREWLTFHWACWVVHEGSMPPMPADWREAYEVLRDTVGFMDRVQVEEHDVDPEMAIIMPNGTVWYFGYVHEFLKAWQLAHEGAGYAPGNPALKGEVLRLQRRRGVRSGHFAKLRLNQVVPRCPPGNDDNFQFEVAKKLQASATELTQKYNLKPGFAEATMLLTVACAPLDRAPNATETRWLTSDDYNRLLGCCWDEMHKKVVEFACNTGLRHGKLAALRKPMIHLHNREMFIPDQLNKNRKPRMVPLNPIAFRTVQKLCETAPCELVFWHRNTRRQGFGEPAPFTSFRGFFQKSPIRAELNDVRFHDLRHTFASRWVQSEGDLLVLKDILGHSTLDMVQRYAHLNTAAHRAAMDKFVPHSFRTFPKEAPARSRPTL